MKKVITKKITDILPGTIVFQGVHVTQPVPAVAYVQVNTVANAIAREGESPKTKISKCWI